MDWWVIPLQWSDGNDASWYDAIVQAATAEEAENKVYDAVERDWGEGTGEWAGTDPDAYEIWPSDSDADEIMRANGFDKSTMDPDEYEEEKDLLMAEVNPESMSVYASDIEGPYPDADTAKAEGGASYHETFWA